jgi:hypothetical protein
VVSGYAAESLVRPAAIIAPVTGDRPTRVSAYRGQSFIWVQQPEWRTGIPANVLDWLLYRQALGNSDEIVLWVRNDLFPDNRNTQEQDPNANSPAN